MMTMFPIRSARQIHRAEKEKYIMNSIVRNTFLLFVVLMGGCIESPIDEKREMELIFETEFDYKLEKKDDLNFVETDKSNGLDFSIATVKALKQDRTLDFNFDSERYLSHYLAKKIFDNKLTIKVNGKEIGREELQAKGLLEHRDTTSFDGKFESGYVVTSNEVWKEWEFYTIKQSWSFNKKTKKLNCSVVDVVPIYYDKLKRKIESFSISFNQRIDNPDSIRYILNDQRNIWVKETSNFISFDKMKVLNGADVDLEKMFWSDPIEGNVNVFFKNNKGAIETFDFKLLQQERIDTIITFDPITYKEKMEILKQPIPEFKDIVAYNIEQIWYFDNKDLKLKCQLKGVEPLVMDMYEKKLKGLFYLKQ